MQVLLPRYASCVNLGELLPLSEPRFLFLRTESRSTTKWLGQLTQARGMNTCPLEGGNEL